MNFVEERLKELGETESGKNEKLPITVKLSENVVADLEFVASKLQLTRHALIVQMLEHGSKNAKETLEKFNPLYE